MRTTFKMVAALALLAGSVAAQDSSATKPLNISGQINAYTEKYSFSGTGTAAHDPTTARLEASVNISVYDLVQIPLSLILATDQVSFRQNINQIAIHPHYKWVTLHAGTYTPQFSELTLSDASMLGGGLDLAPQDFHLSVAAGRIAKAVETGDANAQYTRDLFALQAGYGDFQHSYVDINIVRSADLSSTLPDSSLVTPQSNLVTSIRFQVKTLENRLTVSNELSGSAYTRNTRAPESDGSDVGIFKPFFTSRTSSTADWGVVNTIRYEQQNWSSDLKTAYIRPAYVSFGCSQLQADRFEYTLGGKARFMENALILTGTIGQRRNNLEGDQENTTKNMILNFTSSYQVVRWFGFNVVFGKNNVDIKSSNDTTTISNINNMISIVPRFLFTTGDLQHCIVLSTNYQNSNNTTNRNIQMVDTRTLANLFNYTLIFPSPLSINTSVVYTVSTIDTIHTKVLNITPTVNYSFLEGTLTTSAGVEIGYVKSIGDKGDAEFYPQLSAAYSVTKRSTLSFSLTHRIYTYGSTLPGGKFNETIASLRYTLAF